MPQFAGYVIQYLNRFAAAPVYLYLEPPVVSPVPRHSHHRQDIANQRASVIPVLNSATVFTDRDDAQAFLNEFVGLADQNQYQTGQIVGVDSVTTYQLH